MRIEHSSLDRRRGRPRHTLAWAVTSVVARIVLLLCTVLVPPGLHATGARGQEAPGCGQRGTQDLYVVAADGGSAENMTNSGTFNYLPAWSPDGTQLAFMTTRDCNAEIYVSDADGTNPRNLSDSEAYDTMPAWSGDGTRIAFAVENDEGSDIYVVDADGGNRINVTDSPGRDATPAWSPDGTRLAFASDRTGLFQIYLIDMTTPGQSAIQLTDAPVPRAYPSWSADGERLAYVTGAGEIGIVNVTGANDTIALNERARAQNVAWSPSGDRLAFTSAMEGNQEIYVSDLDGGNMVNLTRHPAADSSPAWSPDGSRIIFSSGRYVAPTGSDAAATPVAGTPEAAGVDDLFDCASRIEVVQDTWHLRSDCTASSPLVLLDGVTFDGHGHTMWVIDGETTAFAGNVIGRSGGSASVRNVTIDGSHLTLACGQGDFLQGVSFFAVEGTIANVTVQHLIRDPGTNCGFGIVVEGPESIEPNQVVANTTVENATVRNVGGIGIFVWDTVNATITGNEVIDAGHRGIGFLGRGATGAVSGNTITGAGHIGIGIEASTGVIVSDNTVTDSATVGIVASYGASDIRVERNQITGARFGIAFEGEATSGTATANNLADLVNGGIVTYDGAESTVSGNHIANVDGAGVSSDTGATVTATGNRIVRAERALVVTNPGSRGDYRNNFISDSIDAGAMINKGATATLRRNRITGGDIGIYVSGADTVAGISNSTITGVASTGIMVIDQATATINGNEIRNAGGVGTLIAEAGTSATVERNTIVRLDPVSLDQPTAGIVVQRGASAEVIDNTISGYVDNGPRDWCGIDVQPDSGNVHLKGNLFPGTEEWRNLCYPGSDELRPEATPVATPD